MINKNLFIFALAALFSVAAFGQQRTLPADLVVQAETPAQLQTEACPISEDNTPLFGGAHVAIGVVYDNNADGTYDDASLHYCSADTVGSGGPDGDWAPFPVGSDVSITDNADGTYTVTIDGVNTTVDTRDPFDVTDGVTTDTLDPSIADLLTFVDGDTINYVVTAGASGPEVTGEVVLSIDAGNSLTLGTDGALYVPTSTGEATTVSDTDTVDLTLTGVDITADVVIDPAVGNALSSSAAGLFAADTFGSHDVSDGTTTSALDQDAGDQLDFVDGDGIDFVVSDTANGPDVTAEIVYSNDVGNTATAGTDGGVFVPAGSTPDLTLSTDATTNGEAIVIGTEDLDLSLATPDGSFTLVTSSNGWTLDHTPSSVFETGLNQIFHSDGTGGAPTILTKNPCGSNEVLVSDGFGGASCEPYPGADQNLTLSLDTVSTGESINLATEDLDLSLATPGTSFTVVSSADGWTLDHTASSIAVDALNQTYTHSDGDGNDTIIDLAPCTTGNVLMETGFGVFCVPILWDATQKTDGPLINYPGPPSYLSPTLAVTQGSGDGLLITNPSGVNPFSFFVEVVLDPALDNILTNGPAGLYVQSPSIGDIFTVSSTTINHSIIPGSPETLQLEVVDSVITGTGSANTPQTFTVGDTITFDVNTAGAAMFEQNVQATDTVQIAMTPGVHGGETMYYNATTGQWQVEPLVQALSPNACTVAGQVGTVYWDSTSAPPVECVCDGTSWIPRAGGVAACTPAI